MTWTEVLQKRVQERLLHRLRYRLLDALHSGRPLTDPDELKRLVRQMDDVL